MSCINYKLYLSFWSSTVSASLLLLAGDIHKNPGPLTFCHWNLGGLPTDNFAKKYLLEAFLVANDFDIVLLGETHLTSQIDENDGYSIKRCDHPDGKPRGGIAVFINQICLLYLSLNSQNYLNLLLFKSN